MKSTGIISYKLSMTDKMITNENELVVGNVYKLEFGNGFSVIIKPRYTYYIYNGFKQLNNGAEFYEFVSVVKRYSKRVLAVYKNTTLYQHGNPYFPSKGNDGNYKFAAMGCVDYIKGMLNTYNIYDINPEDDLYGYEQFEFNIYETNK